MQLIPVQLQQTDYGWARHLRLICVACGGFIEPVESALVDLTGKAYQAYYHLDCTRVEHVEGLVDAG